MAKESSPAYQRYPKDYLSDINVQAMTIEEEGCYNRLMDYCWIEGYLPDDLAVLASLCKGVTPTARVLGCFSAVSGVLVHKRLDEERAKQEAWREKCAKGGKRSASKRKHKKSIDTEQGSATNLPRVVEVKGNSAVCSLQSSNKNASHSLLPARSKRVPEDFQVTDEMRLWAAREYPGVDVEMETRLFRDHTYKTPRSDWDANWRNWIKNAAGWHGGNGKTRPAAKQAQAMNDDDFNFDGEGIEL